MLKTILVHIEFFFLAFYVTFVTFSQKKGSLIQITFQSQKFLVCPKQHRFRKWEGRGKRNQKILTSKRKNATSQNPKKWEEETPCEFI